MVSPALVGVPIPLQYKPETELREITRWQAYSDMTIVEYVGSDGHTYHEAIGLGASTWLLTRNHDRDE